MMADQPTGLREGPSHDRGHRGCHRGQPGPLRRDHRRHGRPGAPRRRVRRHGLGRL